MQLMGIASLHPSYALSRDQTLADVDFRRADRVLPNDFAPIEKNHERLLIAFSAAMNQAHIGNKVRGLRVHSGEIVFPYFVAAISEGGLCRVAIYSAHILLGVSSFNQCRGPAPRWGAGNAFIPTASPPAKKRR